MVLKENIDAVMGFLPALTEVSKGEVARYRESALEPECHPQVSAFMKALNQNNFVQSFDWPSWQPEAEKRYKNPELLAQANLETCINSSRCTYAKTGLVEDISELWPRAAISLQSWPAAGVIESSSAVGSRKCKKPAPKSGLS